VLLPVNVLFASSCGKLLNIAEIGRKAKPDPALNANGFVLSWARTTVKVSVERAVTFTIS